MSDSSNITIVLQAQSEETPPEHGSADCWLELEQRPFPDSSAETSLSTLFSMISLAKIGVSSRVAVPSTCPWITADPDGTVVIKLPFYIWPYDMGLNFNLSCSSGEIVDLQVVEPRTEFSMLVTGSSYDIGKLFTGSVAAESPVFTPTGSVRAMPGYTINRGQVEFGDSIICACRASGVFHGYKAFAQMTLMKKDEDGNIQKITQPTCIVKAKWQCWDDEKEEWVSKATQIPLDFPECVSAFLEACDDGRPLVCFDVAYPEEKIPVVFYSTCTGKKMPQGPYYLTSEELGRLTM